MTALKEQIQKRTEEIILQQKAQGFWNFQPHIAPAHKAALEADFKMAAMVDACVEVLVEFDSRLSMVEAGIHKILHPAQNEGQSDTVGV